MQNQSAFQAESKNFHYIFLSVIPIWTFFTNGIVLTVFFREKSLRNNMANITIASLTLADFLLALFVLPLAVYFKVNGGWNLGFPLHLAWFCSDVFFSSSSIMNLCVISVYRYLAIAYPYRISYTISVKHIIFLLLGAWGLSFLVSLAMMTEAIIYQTFDEKLVDLNNIPQNHYKNITLKYMMGDKPFLIYGSILTFFLPLTIMLFTVVRSIQMLKKQSTLSFGLRQVMNCGMQPQQIIGRPKSKTVKMKFSENLKLFKDQDPDGNYLPISSTVENLITITSSKEISNIESKSLKSKDRMSSSGNFSLLPFPIVAPQIKQCLTQTISLVKTTSKNVYIISSKERRAIRTLLIVLVFFVLCWFPFFTLQLVIAFTIETKFDQQLLFDFAWPGYASSGINPVIYAVFHPEYNLAIKRWLLHSCCKK